MSELSENSVYGLKVFDMQELVNGERFAGGSQTNVYKKQIVDGPVCFPIVYVREMIH